MADPTLNHEQQECQAMPNGSHASQTVNNSCEARAMDSHNLHGARVSRLFKKSSNDGNLTLFLPKRELHMQGETGTLENLEGVVLIYKELASRPTEVKVFIQVSLELRYGREDEELMGLQFCNEMVVISEELFPLTPTESPHGLPKPEDLLEKHGCLVVPFRLDLGSCLPPTIRLKPTRNYTGSPIGTTYTISVYPAELDESKALPGKSAMISMVVWVTEIFPPIMEIRPVVVLHRTSRVFNGDIKLQATLNKNLYKNGEPVLVNLTLDMKPARKVKYILVTAVQAVDVAMFSSGYFKNEVGQAEVMDLGEVDNYSKQFELCPEYRPGKHWVAVTDWGNLVPKVEGQPLQLAASVVVKERSLFIIRVMYFIQIRVKLARTRRELQLKLPFLLASEKACQFALQS